MPARPVALLLLALAAASPSASALSFLASAPEPVKTEGPALADVLWLVEEALEKATDTIRLPSPDQFIDIEVGVTIECRTTETGQTECRGHVCMDSDDEGDGPLSLGHPEDDRYGVGVDPQENPDGTYGPYEGVFVSVGGTCGCTGWVQVPWLG